LGKGEVDEKKGDKKDGLRKKGHVAAAAGELGEELSARAGAWKLVRAERESVGKRLFRLGAGMPGPRGKKQRHGAATNSGQLLGGPPLSKRILVSSPKRDSFAGISRIHLALSL
jgi:hypothetical protein